MRLTLPCAAGCIAPKLYPSVKFNLYHECQQGVGYGVSTFIEPGHSTDMDVLRLVVFGQKGVQIEGLKILRSAFIKLQKD